MLKTVKQIHTIKRAIFILAATALPLGVHAAGLGKISVLSALGQSFKGEIEVFATSDEAQSLQAKLAAVDAFRQADIEYVPVLASLKFSPVKERDGRRYIQVTTDRPLNEPFVDMLVELSWAAGRLVREYTFLLDPPNLVPATVPAPVASPQVEPKEVVVTSAVEIPPVAPSPESPAAVDASPEIAKPVPMVSKAVNADKKSYTVIAGDTLWKVASRSLPEGVSLDQMLVALFRNNQQAFSGSNMNRLRAGKILEIPDSETVSGIAAKEAHQEVVAQAADFNVYRKKLAAIAAAEAASQESAQQATSGKIAPKVEDALPAAGSGKDKLEVSRSEVAKDSKGGKPPDRATAEDNLIAHDRALKEANSRTAELEKNLSNMKKLAELKSQAGADLQQQAQAAKPEVTPLTVPEAQNSAVAAANASGTTIAPLAEMAKPAEAPLPPAAKKKKMILPPEPEPSFMEENGTLVLGGGLLALVLGWFGFTAWKKRKAAAEMGEGNTDSDFSVHSGFSDPSSVTSVAPPSEQQPSQFGGSVSPAEPAMDSLAEADTFLAFGRDAQAEEVLLAALETEPERHAIYLKLLEIYAARKNRAAFASMAKRLHEQTGGDGADWEKTMAMGAVLDPENALYKAASAVATPAMEPPAATQDFGATLVMQASPLLAESPELAAPAAATVDFDLDAEMHTGETVDAAPDMTVMDFDLDLGSSDVAAAPTGTDATLAPLDLPLGDNTAPSAAKAADANSIDFDFDLTLDTPAPAAPLDLGDVDFDLNAAGIADAVSSAPTFDISGGNGVAENPEVATKLELAAAYEEMGDRDGARELYQEALAEGNSAQQEAARSKLANLG